LQRSFPLRLPFLPFALYHPFYSPISHLRHVFTIRNKST
jgi:hypothetical protein